MQEVTITIHLMQTQMRHLPSLRNLLGQTMGQAITIKRAIKVKFE